MSVETGTLETKYYNVLERQDNYVINSNAHTTLVQVQKHLCPSEDGKLRTKIANCPLKLEDYINKTTMFREG